MKQSDDKGSLGNDVVTQPIRVLLVEDDVESGQALKTMLEKRGVAVRLISSAEEALDTFNPDTLDLIVADIRLEGMSGVDLLRRIREETADFPVILLTGFDSLESAIQAVRLGAQDYILKPLEMIEDLLMPVKNAVRNHRLLLQNHALEKRLRSLASELVLAEEKERRCLASDLHDSIGQTLAISKLKLDELLSVMLPAEHAGGLREVRELITQSIRDTRSLTFQLSPPTLYEFGLEVALGDLAEQMQDLQGITIEFEDDRQRKPMDENIRVLLFRAVRELLVNVVKHAQAQNAKVCISGDNNHIQIIVTDDGIGFDPDAKGSREDGTTGFGLFGIRERLHDLGGHLVILSKPSRGTEVTLVAPLERG